eukprot:1893471-Alexandrium_andersonii.AAC.1
MATNRRSDPPSVSFTLCWVGRAFDAAYPGLALLKPSLSHADTSAGLEDLQHDGMCLLYECA